MCYPQIFLPAWLHEDLLRSDENVKSFCVGGASPSFFCHDTCLANFIGCVRPKLGPAVPEATRRGLSLRVNGQEYSQVMLIQSSLPSRILLRTFQLCQMHGVLREKPSSTWNTVRTNALLTTSLEGRKGTIQGPARGTGAEVCPSLHNQQDFRSNGSSL